MIIEIRLCSCVFFYISGKKTILQFKEKHPEVSHDWAKVKVKVVNEKKLKKERMAKRMSALGM